MKYIIYDIVYDARILKDKFLIGNPCAHVVISASSTKRAQSLLEKSIRENKKFGEDYRKIQIKRINFRDTGFKSDKKGVITDSTKLLDLILSSE